MSTRRDGLIFLTAAIAILLLTALAAACSGREATLEERAYALDKQLMCPVCDGQTIDQSNAQIALDMKSVLREKLAAGESEEQIKAYFEARYGAAALASPPASGFTAVVWAVPPAVIVLGIAALAIAMTRMKSNRPGSPGKDEELDEYLAAVDRERGLGDGDGESLDERGVEK